LFCFIIGRLKVNVVVVAAAVFIISRKIDLMVAEVALKIALDLRKPTLDLSQRLCNSNGQSWFFIFQRTDTA
jgi:hypothetical protein